MDGLAVHRKESIISATTEVISDCGIQSVSTKEVAKKLGISEGTIFKYFPKKSDLLYAVLETFTAFDSDIFMTTEVKQMQPREAIIFYIESYLIYYENYPEAAAIEHEYHVLRGDSRLQDKTKNIFMTRAEYIRRLVEKAQEADVISKETNSESLTDIIMSTFRGMCIKWKINNYDFSLREKTLIAIKLLLEAFSRDKYCNI